MPSEFKDELASTPELPTWMKSPVATSPVPLGANMLINDMAQHAWLLHCAFPHGIVFVLADNEFFKVKVIFL